MELETLLIELIPGSPALYMMIALVGGLIVKILTHRLNKKEAVGKEASRIREELRKGLESCQKLLDETRKESDVWRAKYWKEVASHTETRTKLTSFIGYDEEDDEDHGN